jgi:hypothetical protein
MLVRRVLPVNRAKSDHPVLLVRRAKAGHRVQQVHLASQPPSPPQAHPLGDHRSSAVEWRTAAELIREQRHRDNGVALLAVAEAEGRKSDVRSHKEEQAPNVQSPMEDPGLEKSCNIGGISPFNLRKRATISDESRSAPGINREGKWDGRKKRWPGAGCVAGTMGWRRRRGFPPPPKWNRSRGRLRCSGLRCVRGRPGTSVREPAAFGGVE